MQNQRRVIVYIAMSLDGYIAGPGDDLSFLSVAQQEGEDYGYEAFIETIDTVIMGRKTYDWVMTQVSRFPHADIKSYIITRKPLAPIGNVSFYSGNLRQLVLNLTKQDGKNIFIDGGAEIVNILLYEDLIDEFIISVIPVLVGDGVRLFKDGNPGKNLRLSKSEQYSSGVVQLHYQIIH